MHKNLLLIILLTLFTRNENSDTKKEDNNTNEEKIDTVTSESHQKPNTVDKKRKIASPNLIRSLKVTDSDPLSASNVNAKATKKPAEGHRQPRSNRGSLRNRGTALSGDSGVTKPLNKHDVTPVKIQEPTPPKPDTIPMDPESRWREHDIKSQLARSLMMESNEPAISRHLRHAIKSVLHFTAVGPETMDLKAASRGSSHWDSLMAPVILLPKIPVLEEDGLKHAQGTGGYHGVRTSMLSRSTSLVSTKADIPTTTNTSTLSPILEPPLPVDISDEQPSHPATLLNDTMQHIAEQDERNEHSRSTSPPIIVRGFSSSSTHTRLNTAEEDSPNAKSEENATSVPSLWSSSPQHEKSDERGIIEPQNSPTYTPSKKIDIGLQRFGSPTTAQEVEIVETLNSEGQPHLEQLQPQSRSSRIWLKFRRAIQGDNKQDDTSRNTVYLTAGSISEAARAFSDNHLSSRPASPSSTSSSNIAMPSFSSSVMSLLSEDQMSPRMGPTIKTSNLRESMVFETPPETAANTPRPTSSISPISPTSPSSPFRSRPNLQQNLPGLSRKSSTKSSAAAAELTTTESKVSQFMYSARLDSGNSVLMSPTKVANGERQQDFFSIPNLLERSSHKSAIRISSNLEEPVKSPPRAIAVSNPLGRSRSTSDAQYRGKYRNHHEIQQSKDIVKKSSESTAFVQELGMLSPQSGASEKSTSHSIQWKEYTPSSPPSSSKSGAMRISITPYQSTDSGPMSPSELLSGTVTKTKEERRRSAISLGGYFSSTAEATRKSRNQIDHSMTGLEMDIRKPSISDKASPPALTSLSSLLHTNLPSQSQSMEGSGLSLLSRSPSKASDLALIQDQKYSHSRRASAVTMIGPEDGDASRRLSAITTNKNMKGNVAVGGSNVREGRKKVPNLKITTPLISGLPSVPSPMFPPLSATIPRPLASSGAILDKYFFNTDQVHDWNIPSYGRVKFIDHAPLVFQAIRERFNYTLADMDEALSQPMAAMKTPGKSNAIFFASHNHGRFLLKTLRGNEPDDLKAFLGDYLAHIKKHPNTLLPRYLGMYTFERVAASKILGVNTAQHSNIDGMVGGGGGASGGNDKEHGSKTTSKYEATAAQRLHLNGTPLTGKDDGIQKVVVVVLANVFDTPEVVNERYDFKGSNVGRRTLPLSRNGTTMYEKPLENHEFYQRPEFGQSLTELDSIAPTDILRRRSRRGDVAMQENRASFAQSDPRQEYSQYGNEDMPLQVNDDVSNLTLKEMDFQDRVYTGKTRMLVGIRIVPKAPEPVQEDYPSSSSSSVDSLSRRGSVTSESDINNVSDNEADNSSPSDSVKGKVKEEKKGEFAETMDKILKMFDISQMLHEDGLTLLMETAQEALRFISGSMSLGLGDGHRRSSSSQSAKSGQQQPPEVELGPISSTQRISRESRDQANDRKSKKNSAKEEFKPKDEAYDPELFQTVRYKSHNAQEDGNYARRSIIPGGSDEVTARKKSTTVQHQPNQGKDQHTHYMAASPPSGHFLHNTSALEQDLTWSQGIPSGHLPDGYEAVYYFGLIDILQKYTVMKWIEKNVKGVLLGASVPPTPTMTSTPNPSILLAHPGRSTPSTSFSVPLSVGPSSLYQLLPHATTSEPSLPSALDPALTSNPKLSALHESSGSGSALRTTGNRESHLDPSSSSSQFSSARTSQEESTLTGLSEDGSIATTTVGASSHSSSPSNSSNLFSKPRLGSSVPFTKSIGARLSHYSHHSHSSQQSHQSHVSGRSRDSRLSFEIRESDSAPNQTQMQSQFSASPPSFLQQTDQNQSQQNQKAHHVHYQAPEVSVEEPGRYAERLIEFMRGVIV
ncbi:Phosphatidylinositol 5-phosphate 4-kinase type-2 alpha [Haplosporangium sp. Z 27]|nr:Phosphatidylinositol 5-phosphate 4-kinase type-2 alpha [Haplosporangium sp. Z 27]